MAKKKNTSMSIWTSFGLSINNLKTKKSRTIMTSFAGSIGIIGIALILALSTGVNDYINSIEEDTLAQYPLQITSSEFSIASVLGSLTPGGEKDEDAEITVSSVLNTLFATSTANDLSSLKEYIESGESDIYDHVTAIEYDYDYDVDIYGIYDGEVRQVNPDNTLSSISGSSITSMLSSASSTSFYVMPENSSLYEDDYEVMAGHWPESYDECVLVLTSNGSISDTMLYALGLLDYDELEDYIERYNNGEDISIETSSLTYDYDDVLGLTYYVVNPADYYAYDDTYGIWVDKSSDSAYLESVVENSTEITIVGVVQLKEDATSSSLSTGINYPITLLYHIAELAENSEVVQAQLANPGINVFTGEEFGEEESSFDLSSIISIDEDAITSAFDDISLDMSDLDMSSLSIDLSGINIDLTDFDLGDLTFTIDTSSLDISSYFDLSSLDLSDITIDLSSVDLSSLLESIEISSEDLQSLSASILAGYQQYSTENGRATYLSLVNNFSDYLTSDEALETFQQFINDLIAEGEVTISSEDLKTTLENSLSKDDEGNYVYDLDEIVEIVAGFVSENATVSVEISEDDLTALVEALVTNYDSYAQENDQTTTGAVEAGILAYLADESTQQMLTEGLSSLIDSESLQSTISEVLQSYVDTAVSSYTEQLQAALVSQLETASAALMEDLTEQITTQLTAQMTTMMNQMMSQVIEQVMEQMTEQISSSMTSMMTSMMSSLTESISDSLTTAFSDAISINMDSDYLTELITSMYSSSSTTYDGNLETLGYFDFDSPSEIDIYSINYDHKESVLDILEEYNDMMEEAGYTEKTITYTDLSATMLSALSEVIDVVTYVLIAFVAISLIVSSIMISVITQISVMERTKEIGVLRALGASKANVSQVFIAETFILGSCSGLLGVLISKLLIIPINYIIHNVAGNTLVNAALSWSNAFILVAISIVITVLSGLSPALSAAKKDPVTALRTE